MPLPFLEVPVLFLYIHHPLPVLLQLLGLLGRSKLRGNALGSRLGQTLTKVGCLDLVELLGSSGHSFLVVSGNEFVPCDFLVDVRFDLAVRAQVHRHVSLPIRCKALVALVYALDFVSSQYTKRRILNRNYFAMNLIVLAKLP